MKKNSLIIILFGLLLFLTSCKDRKTSEPAELLSQPDSLVMVETVPDSTVYGICGDATSMHALQLLVDGKDTLYYQVDVEEDAHVRGGMMVGDRLAVVGHRVGDELVAQEVVNLTTLLGRWASIDRNFEIQEGGVLLSDAGEPQMGEWRICNGRLVLRSDTFSIYELGTDSLYLENDKGIYVFTRRKVGN